MKKVAIITLYGNANFGNKLQNYALQESIKKIGKYDVVTIKEHNTDIKSRIKRIVKKLLNRKIDKRTQKFIEFNDYINYSNKIYSRQNPKKLDNFDYYVVGSDQVWNPKFDGLSNLDLISFTKSKNKISYAASFGVKEIDKSLEEKLYSSLKDFKGISVREKDAQKILESCNINNSKVVLDPTMLLTKEEWNKLAKKPEKEIKKQYILCYFLGELPEETKKEINKVAELYNCEIINILDKNSEYYNSGPREFLYLEKNAFLICTDSFHSSVFSIIFDVPFVVFERKDNNIKNMNSRIETLLDTFKIKNRKFNKSITKENIKHDYKNAYKILDEKRKESMMFLSKCLDGEDKNER